MLQLVPDSFFFADMKFFCEDISCFTGESDEVRWQRKENRRIEKLLKQEKYRLRRQIKILLLGTGESGKSTIMKQMKIIHGEDLSQGRQPEELRHIVYFNILKGIKVLIDARDKLNIPWGNTDLNQTADLVFRADTNNLITFQYFNRYVSLIEILWNDPGIQATFQKRNEFQLSDGLHYLFKNLKRISSERYIPTNQDLLHARVPTRTVTEYSVNLKGIDFVFIDVGGQRRQRKKWLQCFDKVTSILFVMSLIEYDQHLIEDPNVNRLAETLAVFEFIMKSHFLQRASTILFLNKTDLLAEKLKILRKNSRSSEHRPMMLNDFFPQFPGDPTNMKDVQNFMLNLFECRRENRDLYAHFTTAVDTENIKRVLNDVRETVLRENIRDIINLQ